MRYEPSDVAPTRTTTSFNLGVISDVDEMTTPDAFTAGSKDRLDAGRFGDAERIRFAFNRNEGESATALMFGVERRDFPARRVDNDTGHICRLPGRCLTHNVDAVRQTGNQIAAFRIYTQVQRLQKNRDGFRGGLHSTAVFNNHRDDAFTARDGGGQPETGARIAGTVDNGRTFPGLFAINPGTDRHFGSRRNTTFGPFDMQIGGDHVTGAITIAYKSNLALEARSTVSTDVELALSPAIGRGMRDANRVFASGLTCRNVPGKPGDAVDNRRDTRGDGVAFWSFYLKR